MRRSSTASKTTLVLPGSPEHEAMLNILGLPEGWLDPSICFQPQLHLDHATRPDGVPLPAKLKPNAIGLWVTALNAQRRLDKKRRERLPVVVPLLLEKAAIGALGNGWTGTTCLRARQGSHAPACAGNKKIPATRHERGMVWPICAECSRDVRLAIKSVRLLRNRSSLLLAFQNDLVGCVSADENLAAALA